MDDVKDTNDIMDQAEEEDSDQDEKASSGSPANVDPPAQAAEASVDTTSDTKQYHNDLKPLTFQKFQFLRSAKEHFELKNKNMAVLRTMMIGALNEEVNSFEGPPFSELSIQERQNLQLQRNGLVEEVVRRAYFLYYVDQRDPKRIFQCTRNQFPKPSLWSLERCIEWLNHPIRQLATQDELIWMREEYEAFLVLSKARVTALKQEREAAFSASRAAAARLLHHNNKDNSHGSFATSNKRGASPDDDGEDDYVDMLEESRPFKRRRGRPPREDGTLVQILQSNKSVCFSLEKLVTSLHHQNTLLMDTVCLQAELAALQSRENSLTALLVAREKTRDRRVELQALNQELPQTMVDEAVAACEKTRNELEEIRQEIKILRVKVKEKQNAKAPAVNGDSARSDV